MENHVSEPRIVWCKCTLHAAVIAVAVYMFRKHVLYK